MNLKDFIQKFGRDEAERVAELAGTNWAYTYQCAHGFRRPSVDLAKKLVDASDGRLDMLAILTVEKRTPSKAAA